MFVLINSLGNLQALHSNVSETLIYICIQGSLIYEQKKNDVNGPFTCFTLQRTLLYCGTANGNKYLITISNNRFNNCI